MDRQEPRRPHIVTPELQLFTTAEAAAILNVSLRTMHGWLKDGLLPYTSLGEGGRLVRIRSTDLTEFAQQNYRRS